MRGLGTGGETGRLGRVLGEVQRRPVLSVFGVALVVRWLAALLLGALDLSPNPDEHLFLRLAADVVAGRTDHWWAYADAAYADGVLFVHLLTVVEVLPVPALLGGRLLVGLLGAGVAGVTARIGSDWIGPRAGLAAGLLVAFWPSQVLFSASAIRDTAVWLLLSTTGLAALHGRAARGWSLVGWGAVATSCLVGLLGLRPSTAVVAGTALLVAALCSERRGRPVRMVVVATALIVLPWAAGLGPAATQMLHPEAFGELQRDRAAASAATACTDLGEAAPVTTPSGAIDRIVRAGPVSLLGPYPWTEVCSGWGQAAKVESVLFALLLLVSAGGLVARRGRLASMAFGVALAAGLVLLFSLGQDNVGTAFRHRGQLHWIVALLAVDAFPRWAPTAVAARWGPRVSLGRLPGGIR